MATKTPTVTQTGLAYPAWRAGLLGGLVGGLGFGLLMSLTMPAAMEMMIPGMYGLEGGLAGWFVHMSHAAILGVVFAAIAERRPRYTATVGRSVVAGVVYGVAVWIVLASVVMPIWVGATLPVTPPVPDFNPMSLVGHVVYGALLGGVYVSLRTR
ncbi:histidine kinase [Haloferacaceae archaeon DSL9]